MNIEVTEQEAIDVYSDRYFKQDNRGVKGWVCFVGNALVVAGIVALCDRLWPDAWYCAFFALPLFVPTVLYYSKHSKAALRYAREQLESKN